MSCADVYSSIVHMTGLLSIYSVVQLIIRNLILPIAVPTVIYGTSSSTSKAVFALVH